MAYDPAFAYLIAAGVIVSVLIVISVFCQPDKKKKRRGNEDEGGEAVAGARPRPRVNNVPPGGRARRRPVRRNRMQMGEDDSGDEDMPGRGPPGDEEEEEGMFDDFDQPEGKIGAKKLRKLEEKAEKKRMREMELQEREEKKEREKKLEAQRKREEERRKAEEELQEEQDKLRKEEEEKREHEEYLKMKEMFSVDEEGEDENAANLDSPSLLQEFINYIKEMKVVMLEDLAAHFKLKTQDCIDRIQDLQADGKLTGVVDDRGKFIYITMEELDSVAKYIRQLGRVSISELAESSNRLINLNPDNADVHKKLVVGDNTEVIEVTS